MVAPLWLQIIIGVIGLITSISLFIATAILAGITFFYMQHTKKMANIMTREFELKYSPVFDVDYRKKGCAGYKGGFDIVVRNHGTLPIIFERILYLTWPTINPEKAGKSYELIQPHKTLEKGEFHRVRINVDIQDNPELKEFGELHENFATGFFIFLEDRLRNEIRWPTKGHRNIFW